MADQFDTKDLPQGLKAGTAPNIVIKATGKDGKVVSIGAIQSYSKSMSRSNTRRMELDSDVPGMTAEMIPGAIGDFTITIKRALMNKNTMLEAFGYTSINDLIFQNIPIEVEEHRHRPDGTEQLYILHGCFFKSCNLEVDISRDWTLIETASLDVQYADTNS